MTRNFMALFVLMLLLPRNLLAADRTNPFQDQLEVVGQITSAYCEYSFQKKKMERVPGAVDKYDWDGKSGVRFIERTWIDGNRVRFTREVKDAYFTPSIDYSFDGKTNQFKSSKEDTLTVWTDKSNDAVSSFINLNAVPPLLAPLQMFWPFNSDASSLTAATVRPLIPNDFQNKDWVNRTINLLDPQFVVRRRSGINAEDVYSVCQIGMNSVSPHGSMTVSFSSIEGFPGHKLVSKICTRLPNGIEREQAFTYKMVQVRHLGEKVLIPIPESIVLTSPMNFIIPGTAMVVIDKIGSSVPLSRFRLDFMSANRVFDMDSREEIDPHAPPSGN